MDRETRKKTRIAEPTINNLPSRTKQEGRLDADVNTIVNTFARTGQWANVNPRTPTYGDVSQMLQLEEAVALVQNAQREFMTLPAKVRALANNDPVQFLGLMADPEAVKLLKAAGLPTKEPVVVPPQGGETPTPE